MRMVGWIQRDHYSALLSRLRGLRLDYGRAFETDLSLGPNASSLTVTSCFYRNLFEAESQPQLTACCCCSQDRVWLERAPQRGVSAKLVSSMAEGGERCCFLVAKTQ